jgi:L-amino acid N-acyltransferase YncA
MLKLIKAEAFTDNKEKLASFFQNVPFGRYFSDRNYDNTIALDYELNRLEIYLKNGGVCFAFFPNNAIISGLVGFNFSAWDTDVLKKRTAIMRYFLVEEKDSMDDYEIAVVLINEFHAWVKKNEIDVAITKVETIYFKPVVVLQEMGYVFFECNTIKTVDLSQLKYVSNQDVKYRYARKEDFEKLKELTLNNTFKKSHFYLDKKFEVENVNALYAKWIKTALHSEKKIVLIEDENEIVGIFIYDFNGNSNHFGFRTATWQSAAVNTLFRNKGLGKRLFEAVIQSCIDQKVEIIDTDLVEKNIASQKIHDKFGFKLVHTTYTFHKWFK